MLAGCVRGLRRGGGLDAWLTRGAVGICFPLGAGAKFQRPSIPPALRFHARLLSRKTITWLPAWLPKHRTGGCGSRLLPQGPTILPVRLFRLRSRSFSPRVAGRRVLLHRSRTALHYYAEAFKTFEAYSKRSKHLEKNRRACESGTASAIRVFPRWPTELSSITVYTRRLSKFCARKIQNKSGAPVPPPLLESTLQQLSTRSPRSVLDAQPRQRLFCRAAPRLRRREIPCLGLLEILLHALAPFVKLCQKKHGIRDAAIGGTAIPCRSLFRIAFDTAAFGVRMTEGRCIPSLSPRFAAC